MTLPPEPAAPEQRVPPAGWYRDPAHPQERERWWDGRGWSQHVRSLGSGPQPVTSGGRLLEPGGSHAYAGPQLPVFTPGVVADGPRTADGVRLASWGRRVGAAVIDNVLNSILTLIVLQMVVRDFSARWQAASQGYMTDLLSSAATAAPSAELQHLATLVAIGGGIVTMVTSSALVIGLGATIGQKALGIRACPAGRGQVRVSWQQGLLRCALWTFLSSSGSALIGLLQIVNVFLPLFHRGRLSLVDLVARTQMVKPERVAKAVADRR